jgi:hypothetical protein
MVTPVLVVLSFLLLGVAIFAAEFLMARHAFGAPRVIRCPATSRPAAVRLESFRAAIARTLGREPKIELADCSRWPDAANCARGGMTDIGRDFDATRLSTQIDRWRASSQCSKCGRLFVSEGRGRTRVHFISPNGMVFEWNELPFDWLGEALESWQPLCGGCAAEIPESPPLHPGPL